jgi:hypothetical protein
MRRYFNKWVSTGKDIRASCQVYCVVKILKGILIDEAVILDNTESSFWGHLFDRLYYEVVNL